MPGRSWEPGAGTAGPDVGPAPRSPHLGGGAGETVTAVWPIDFCPHQPGPGEGLGPRWATWVPDLGVSLGQPCQGPGWGQLPLTTPCLPLPVLGPCLLPAHASPGRSQLHRPVAGPQNPAALIYVLLLWGIFSKNRMDVRRATSPQNHA